MSIKIMSLVWENGPEVQAERFVLLALADFANDDGECWPSVTTVAKKTCMSIRGVQQIMRRLEAQGWLRTEQNAGRNGCNKYVVTPARGAPPHDVHPRTACTTPPHLNVNTPAPGAPEPSITINKPKTRVTRFDEFWDAYPHRGGVKRDRKTSLQRYERAVKGGASEQTLIDAAKALHRDRRVIDGYAKDPATWLNKEGWNDGIEADPSQAKDDPLARWKRIAAQ